VGETFAQTSPKPVPLASFSRVREVDCFLEAVEAAVQAHLDEPARAISAAFGTFLAAAAGDPLVRGIVSGESCCPS
jgi:hypothetical protein